MERLTKRIDDNHACFAICEKECPDGIYADNQACMCTAGIAALKKLMEYEDAEERGKLLILPCKPGDTVYILAGRYGKYYEKDICDGFYMGENMVLQIKVKNQKGNHGTYGVLGKTVFLTEQEAKEALEGMKK